MERIISKESYGTVEYNVLGKDLQTLQVFLKPGQKIVVCEKFVISRTEELIKDANESISYKKDKTMSYIYTNVQYEFGYILLNKNGGRIIALDLNDLASIYFDEACILAYTPNAMTSKETMKFYNKSITKAIPAKSNKPNFNPKSGYVFLQLKNFDSLIEKGLEEEPLIVKTNKVIAISGSLISNSQRDKDCVLPNTVKLKGPGKVLLKASSATILREPENVLGW
eukprot:TRINITY_DN10693_c0_g3_i1.p1 TRINITY_DN10693_c0_g3~~TRINITY_DN10693_c0_g3_i1.p1  ORF type:complete len:225 (+),score=35.44 TRINITY_DN10693_c0_g3_i1:123-797(+)